MPTVSIVLENNPEAADFVTERLKEYNDAGNPLVALRRQTPNDPREIHVFARDADGKIVGGIVAHIWQTWKWLEIDIVWVDESCRGQGTGAELMDAIEAAGIEAGCTRARLSTWDYQAPEFYKKRGYIVYGVLENFPEGATDYRMWKPL